MLFKHQIPIMQPKRVAFARPLRKQHEVATSRRQILTCHLIKQEKSRRRRSQSSSPRARYSRSNAADWCLGQRRQQRAAAASSPRHHYRCPINARFWKMKPQKQATQTLRGGGSQPELRSSGVFPKAAAGSRRELLTNCQLTAAPHLICGLLIWAPHHRSWKEPHLQRLFLGASLAEPKAASGSLMTLCIHFVFSTNKSQHAAAAQTGACIDTGITRRAAG